MNQPKVKTKVKQETPEISWSPQQTEALSKVKAWLEDKKSPQIFRLFGYAGTGKTTLAKQFIGEKGEVMFAAFTGKAAQVLRNKGCVGATTIHSLIYTAHRDPITGIVTFRRNYDSALCNAKLLIVDEVSMVGEEIAKDLLSFGKPILVLGDPAQLPPVKGTGFFINEKPDFLLTEVHRQAAENPIIRLSMDVREGKELTYHKTETGGVTLATRSGMKVSEVNALAAEADQILCGLNRTRTNLNNLIRQHLGRKDQFPEVGDRLVCLRNDYPKGLFNGSLWETIKVTRSNDRVDMHIKALDTDGVFVDVSVLNEFFLGKEQGIDWRRLRGTQQFTYGYALTVHKAQGSQWDNVLLFDESFIFGEDEAKHLYTGVTRAAINLTVVR